MTVVLAPLNNVAQSTLLIYKGNIMVAFSYESLCMEKIGWQFLQIMI